MPKTFTEWTVLPHDPIEKVTDNVWRVSGKLGDVQRQMVLARRKDGNVVVYNAIALEDGAMKDLEKWGAPSILAVPNGFHRQDAAIWKKRYSAMTVVAPPAGKKKVEAVVPVDATTTDAPADEDVKLFTIDGCPGEVCMEIRSGGDVTLVFSDALMNQPKMGGVIGFMLAPTGTVATPRIMRWFAIKDKRAFVAHLERLASTPGLKRILFGHGKPITDDPGGAIRKAVTQLGG